MYFFHGDFSEKILFSPNFYQCHRKYFLSFQKHEAQTLQLIPPDANMACYSPAFCILTWKYSAKSHFACGILQYHCYSILVLYHFLVFNPEKIVFLPETSPLKGYLNTAISGLNIYNCSTLDKQNLDDTGRCVSLYKPFKMNKEPSLHLIKSTRGCPGDHNTLIRRRFIQHSVLSIIFTGNSSFTP